VVKVMTWPFCRQERDPFSFCRRLSETQGRSGWVLNISPPPGLDPLTFQLVASRCIDYDIPVLSIVVRILVLYSLVAGLKLFYEYNCIYLNSFQNTTAPKLLLIKKTNTTL
jgi:hypothetical protein